MHEGEGEEEKLLKNKFLVIKYSMCYRGENCSTLIRPRSTAEYFFIVLVFLISIILNSFVIIVVFISLQAVSHYEIHLIIPKAQIPTQTCS